jgi:LysR family glycine cleavage system transcriptional activator
MTDRLPPLTALRAFEAAGRHLSFAQAARELNVTPAALSFQIKSLEEHLGAPVFIRHNRRVELTDAGRNMLPFLSQGFGSLSDGWDVARQQLGQTGLTVTAGPAFLAGWLAPRMGRFIVAHPELDLRLTASLRFLNFQRDGIDLAIRFGTSSDDGLFSERLFQEWATPMMTPELAKKINTPQDLLQVPLISQGAMESLSVYEGWNDWGTAVGLRIPKKSALHISSPEAALSYAANGAGAVMGRVSLADEYLRSGRLVAPLAQAIRRPLYYRLVCPMGSETRPSVLVFRDWIKSEVATLSEWEAGREFI